MNSWRKKRIHTQWYYVFGYSIPIFLLISLISNNSFLFSISFLLSCLFLLNYFYLIYSSKNIVIEKKKISRKLFLDEEGTLELTFINKGKFPIFFVKGIIRVRTFDAAITLPHMTENDENILHDDVTLQLERSFFLRKQGKRTMKIKLKALKRGTGEISSIHVELYDLLQLFHKKLQYTGSYHGEVVVYPLISKVGSLQNFVQRERGEFLQPFSLYEDLMQMRGARDYVSRDPFNRIHWKASARMNTLQTKEFDKINILKWTIVVNVRKENNIYHVTPTIDDLEHVLKQVAYVCQFATEKNILYEIYINIKTPNSPYGIHLPLNNGKEHLKKSLELLARIRKMGFTFPIDKTIQFVASDNTHHSTIIHFGPYDDQVVHVYEQIKKSGGHVVFIPRKEPVDVYEVEGRREATL